MFVVFWVFFMGDSKNSLPVFVQLNLEWTEVSAGRTGQGTGQDTT